MFPLRFASLEERSLGLVFSQKHVYFHFRFARSSLPFLGLWVKTTQNTSDAFTSDSLVEPTNNRHGVGLFHIQLSDAVVTAMLCKVGLLWHYLKCFHVR